MYSMYKKLIFLINIIVLTTLLTSCGFHLQGKHNFSPEIANLIITLNEYSEFHKLLVAGLERNDINIVDKDTNLKFAVLEIDEPAISEEIHSYDSKGQVSQYKLTATLNYKLFAKDGRKLKENTIIKRRVYSIHANQLLSNANEKQVISEELNIEIINELLKQLSLVCN